MFTAFVCRRFDGTPTLVRGLVASLLTVVLCVAAPTSVHAEEPPSPTRAGFGDTLRTPSASTLEFGELAVDVDLFAAMGREMAATFTDPPQFDPGYLRGIELSVELGLPVSLEVGGILQLARWGYWEVHFGPDQTDPRDVRDVELYELQSAPHDVGAYQLDAGGGYLRWSPLAVGDATDGAQFRAGAEVLALTSGSQSERDGRVELDLITELECKLGVPIVWTSAFRPSVIGTDFAQTPLWRNALSVEFTSFVRLFADAWMYAHDSARRLGIRQLRERGVLLGTEGCFSWVCAQVGYGWDWYRVDPVGDQTPVVFRRAQLQASIRVVVPLVREEEMPAD